MPYFEPGPQIKLHYLDLNPDAIPVLLLHGLGANCESWQLQIPTLINHGYRVLALDIPGFGKSSYPNGKVNIVDTARLISEWLEYVCTGPVTIIGVSMGGVIALQLALDFPNYVGKIVLISAFAHFEFSRAQTWTYYLARFFLIHVLGLPAQAKAVARRVFPNPGRIGYQEEIIRQICEANPARYRAFMRALARFDVLNRLSEVTKPVLIITGEKDTTILPVSQTRLAVGLANSRQIIIPDAGHAVNIDQPAIINNVIIEFLEEGLR